MTKRTARDFSRYEISKIAKAYANTPINYSCEYFSREYRISIRTFYTLLEKAVVESIVDDSIVDLMQAKAMGNSEIKAGLPGAIRSQKHYEHLKMKRNIYCPSKSNAAKLTIDYANSTLHIASYAKKICMTPEALKRIIRTSVAEKYVSQSIVDLLKEKHPAYK